jgi:hypothetical protein
MIFGEKSLKHAKQYRGLQNGTSQIICSCGWESPAVDESNAFTLGRKQRSVESYFEEHLALSGQTVETAMREPAEEKAVAPAQKPQAKKSRR